MKKNIIIALVLALLLGGIYYFTSQVEEPIQNKQPKAKAIMILIEYKDTVGLANFVNEMKQRNIPGLLMVTPEFVQSNCEEIKEIIKHDIEIVASNIGAPLWDIPYDEQKQRILEMKEGIEACTNVPIRIISSTYMASDTTTVKVAEELGIPFITARGTTDTKATIYNVEDHPGVKILSVSNIPKVEYKYGSLCDYSYYERNGSPEDMWQELQRSLEPLTSKEKQRYGEYHKITPVSHTNIGGYLKPWMDMWIDFWDSEADKIEWVGLDEFMEDNDWELPLWQIPLNKNNPYTPEKIRPAVSYDDIEKIHNPCLVEDIGNPDREETIYEEKEAFSVGNKMMMFHNGQGDMCLEMLEFLEEIDYPIEEYLDTDPGFREKLDSLLNEFSSSEGIHPLFNYYPITFIKTRAFSGFNESIGNEILKEIEK
ncbi:MAG: hypothetical protein PHE76_02720 [Candidatus Pacebacteria bacterium]|nr:hypothetical protein [Candidatus Paceibacterota bacterium]